jgi:hypothetical protein
VVGAALLRAAAAALALALIISRALVWRGLMPEWALKLGLAIGDSVEAGAELATRTGVTGPWGATDILIGIVCVTKVRPVASFEAASLDLRWLGRALLRLWWLTRGGRDLDDCAARVWKVVDGEVKDDEIGSGMLPDSNWSVG